MKVDKSLTSGSTTMLILKLLERQDMYGYQMIEELEKQSNQIFTLKAGTLYPILHGLEQNGMVTAYEGEEVGTRPRRYYQLTKKGKKLLLEKEKEWNLYTKTVNQVLGGAGFAIE